MVGTRSVAVSPLGQQFGGERGEGGEHARRISRSPRRIGAEQRRQQGVQRRVNVRHDGAGGRDGLCHRSRHHVRRAALEDLPSDQATVQQAAQRKHVRGGRQLVARDLLGRHVAGGPRYQVVIRIG